MEHHKLDSIDLRILSELQNNGRITNVELSRRAKITAPPCLRRMRALEKAGYIRGYHADLDPKHLGYEVGAFVYVGLASQAEADCEPGCCRTECRRAVHRSSASFGQTSPD